MDKTLQTKAWNCLPKEFKEEVKKRYLESASISDSLKYQYEKGITKNQYDLGVVNTYKNIFGTHNLTSDAEGEENNIDLAKLNKKLDTALNSETKESLEEWMEQDDDSNTRLQISAQLLSGLLASGKEKHPVRRAFELTDALMAENKKR